MHFFAKAIAFYCACNLFFQAANADIIGIHISLPRDETSYSGRLFVAFTLDTDSEPRLTIGDEAAPRNASPFFAVDVANWDGTLIEFQPTAGFPLDSINQLEEGSWQVQALLDVNVVLSDLDSPSNRFSLPQKVMIGSSPSVLRFELTEKVEEESLPDDTELLKFIRIRSELLSQFYEREIFLRASVLLPSDYVEGSNTRYPVLYHVAGLNGRFTRSQNLIDDEEFMQYWFCLLYTSPSPRD